MQKISKLKYSMLGTWLTSISYKLALELNVIKERERDRERDETKQKMIMNQCALPTEMSGRSRSTWNHRERLKSFDEIA